MSRHLAEALQDNNAQFRVTQICNVLQDAVINGDQQNRMAMLKKLVDVDINDAEINQPLLIFEILLQTLAMPKAADLDSGNRAEIAAHAVRYLNIFFARSGDRVTISKEFKAAATERVEQLLAVSQANIRVLPECAFQFHMKRMEHTLHCIKDSTASPYPSVALSLIQAAATLSLSNLADAAIGALKVICADLVDSAVQMLEGELLSRLAALDFVRVAPQLSKLADVLEEKGDDALEIEVPEFDVDVFIEKLGGTLSDAASFHWMNAYAAMDSLMALCKLGMSVQRVSLVLFGCRDANFNPDNKTGIASYCTHGEGFFDSINPLSNNWRIREKAVNSLIAAHKQTKNKGLRAAIASILADRRMLEKDERVSLILNRPDLVTEFNELLKKDWQERSDVYLTAIGDLNAKITAMMGKAEQTASEDERAETQQQIAEAREYLQVLMGRMTSVSKELGKLDTISDQLTEFRDEHQKQWQKFEARFGAEIERLERRRQDDQAAVMGKLDQIHQLMAAMQAGGGSSAEPVLQLEEIVAKLKGQYLEQELDMVMTKDRIPLEKIFIQLAVVESNIGGKLSEEAKRHSVPLPQMFRERKRHAVKKVLIVGKAGVGKTTLCKKFTFDWATGALWPQFRFVFVLKFRNVNRQRYALPDEQHLAHALVREQLSDRGVEHTSALMTAVRDILKNHLDETLIVCDGYDESTDTPPSIIDDLFRCPNVIFTSRPYGIEQIVNRFDLHIENIGFTVVHIKEYVRMFFDALRGGDEGVAAGKSLIAFLDSNPNILVTSTVPVNLQLVCSLFLRQRDIFSGGHISIGSLYNKLVEYLIEGYFERESVINPPAMDSAVRRVCGKIAFQGITNSHVVLPNRLMQSAVAEEPLFEQNILNLFRVGLIKPAIEGKHVPLWKQDGFFLHLTFQEYFAATWLAAHMSTSDRRQWLRENKFTPRLSLTICFTMSILMIEERADEIVDGFGAIMEAPVDEAQLVQSLLVLRAFDELSVPVIHKVERSTKAVSFAMRLMSDVIQRGETDAVGHIADFMERTSLITSAPEIAGSLDGVLGDPKSSDAASSVLLAMGKYYPTHPVTLRAYIASLGLLRSAATDADMRLVVSRAVSTGRMERFVALMVQYKENTSILDFVIKSASESPLLLLGLIKPMLVGASLHKDTRAYRFIEDVLRRNTRDITERHMVYNDDDDWVARFEYRASGVEGQDPFVHDRREWSVPTVTVPKLDFTHDVIHREVLDAFGRERDPTLQRALLGVIGPASALREVDELWSNLDASNNLGIDEVLMRLHMERYVNAGCGSFVATCIESRLGHYSAPEGLRQYWSLFVHQDEASASWKCLERHLPGPLMSWVSAQLQSTLARLVRCSREPVPAISELTALFTSVPPEDGTAQLDLHDLSHRLRAALVESYGGAEALIRLDKILKDVVSATREHALKYQMWVTWCMDREQCDRATASTPLSVTLHELSEMFVFRNVNAALVAERGDPHLELDPELRLLRATEDAVKPFEVLMALPTSRHTHKSRSQLFNAFLRLRLRGDRRISNDRQDPLIARLLLKLMRHPLTVLIDSCICGPYATRYFRPSHDTGRLGRFYSNGSGNCNVVQLQRHWSHELERVPVRFLLRVGELREKLVPQLLEMAMHKEFTNCAMQQLFCFAHAEVTAAEARSILLRVRDIVQRQGGFSGCSGINYLHRVAFLFHHSFANDSSVTAVLRDAQQSASTRLAAFACEIAPSLMCDPDAGPQSVQHYATTLTTSIDQPVDSIQSQLVTAIREGDELLQTAVATAVGRMWTCTPELAITLPTEAPLLSLMVLPISAKVHKEQRKLHEGAMKQYRDLRSAPSATEEAPALQFVDSIAAEQYEGVTEDDVDEAGLDHSDSAPRPPSLMAERQPNAAEPSQEVPPPSINVVAAIAYRLATGSPAGNTRLDPLAPGALFTALLDEFTADARLIPKFLEVRGASLHRPQERKKGGKKRTAKKKKKSKDSDDDDDDGDDAEEKFIIRPEFVTFRLELPALAVACMEAWVAAVVDPQMPNHRSAIHFVDCVAERSNENELPALRSLLATCVSTTNMGVDALRTLITHAPSVLRGLHGFGELSQDHACVVVEAARQADNWDLLMLLSPKCFKQTPLTEEDAMSSDNSSGTVVSVQEDGLVCLDSAHSLVEGWQERGLDRSVFLSLMPVGCRVAKLGPNARFLRDGRLFPFTIRALAAVYSPELSEHQIQVLRGNLQRSGLMQALRAQISGARREQQLDDSTRIKGKGGKLPGLQASLPLLFHDATEDLEWGPEFDAICRSGVPPPLSRDDGGRALYSLLSDILGLSSIIPRFAVLARHCASNFVHISQDFFAGIDCLRTHLAKGLVYPVEGGEPEVEKQPPKKRGQDSDEDEYDEYDDVDEQFLHPGILPGDDHFYSVYLVECFCKQYGLLLCDKCMTTVKTPGNSVQVALSSRFAASDVLPVLFAQICSSCATQLGQILATISGRPNEPKFTVFERFLSAWSVSEPAALQRVILSNVEKLKVALRANEFGVAKKIVGQFESVEKVMTAEGGGRHQNWKLWYTSVMTTRNGPPPTTAVDYQETFFWLFRERASSAGSTVASLAVAKDPRLDHLLHFFLNVAPMEKAILRGWMAEAVKHSADAAYYFIQRVMQIDPGTAYRCVVDYLRPSQDVEEDGNVVENDRPKLELDDIALPSLKGLSSLGIPQAILDRAKACGGLDTLEAVLGSARELSSVMSKGELATITHLANPSREVVLLMQTVAAVVVRNAVAGWSDARKVFTNVRFLQCISDSDAIMESLAVPSVRSQVLAFVPCDNIEKKGGNMCVHLSKWCALLRQFAQEAAELIDATHDAIELVSKEPRRLRQLKSFLYDMIDLPSSKNREVLEFLQSHAAEIEAAHAAADALRSAAAKLSQQSQWWINQCDHINDDNGRDALLILNTFFRFVSGKPNKSWTSTRLWIKANRRRAFGESISVYTIGKHAQADFDLVAQTLDTEAWGSSIHALPRFCGEYFTAMDNFLRHVVAYQKAAEPVLRFQAQIAHQIEEEQLAEANAARLARVNSLMFSMWVWAAAEEDFKQQQLSMFPIRNVLDAVGAARKANDAMLERWLMAAACTICRAQQRALVKDAADPNVFVFTEDNTAVQYTIAA